MSSITQFQEYSNNSAGGGSVMSQQGNFQQIQSGVGANNVLAISAQQQAQQAQAQQQAKDINAITLCRLGQETVQEVISRMQELFQTLKAAQPPDGKFTHSPTGKPKFQETLRNIKATFKRLRLIYEKLEENSPSEKVVNFEADILHKSELDSPTTPDDKKNSEAYKLAVEEYRDIVEQVMLRNLHLKETIHHLRQIIWDVNTMLSMRKE